MKHLQFAAVAAIRRRHEEDVRSQHFTGRALLAHEDRAELLAIIERLYQRMEATTDEAEKKARKDGS